MFVNTGGGGKTQQPLQNQKNAPLRHNNPYPHSHTQQQPHYEHHQSQITFMANPFCNVTPATHGNASGNNVAVNAGQGGRVLYHAPQQPQQQVGLHNAEPTLYYFTKSTQLPGQPLHHVPQQHSQINMITAVTHQHQPYLVPHNYFPLTHALLSQARPPNLANAGSQHTVAAPSGSSMANQHHSSTSRNAGSTGPTAYVPPPYCRAPLLLGAASSNVPPQPASILTAATGVGQPPNLQPYTYISSGIQVAPSSPVSMNIQPAVMRGGTATNTEYNTNKKERKFALSIRDPKTNEIVPYEDLVDAQPKSQAQKITTVESVSIQTDNDRSITASIASDHSEAAVETQSQSVSATGTDKNDIQMQNEQDDYDLTNNITALTTATTIVCIPDADATTQSLHSGSESAKIYVSEDPNDTDADTNEHELDNEDEEVIGTTVENLSEISIDQQMTVTTSEEQTEEIPNTHTVIEQIGESETDRSTETEAKSKDEMYTISVEAPVIKKPEEKRKEVHQKTQPPVSSSAFNESKKSRKSRKAKRMNKNQKKPKQQSKSNNVSVQNAENNASAQVKGTGVGNKVLESKSNISKDPPKKEELQARFIRYTLEELKALANSPDSCKTPVVPCQKGDYISQLFVARHQHLSHQVGHSLNAINLQSYHHMNFNDSLDFVSGKRRVGGTAVTRKHHEHHINASSSTASNNVGQQSANTVGGGSSQLSNKMPVIRINLSLNEEIKLSECKNAWQPKFLSSNTNNQSQAESGKDGHDNIEDTLKKVRGILNKLTSENFEVLLKEMTSVNINTHEKMKEVMLLIFEKTVSEPNFAPTYAKFSKVLFEEVKEESKNEFNSLLIKRLEKEFELNVNNADAKERKLEKIIDKLNETKEQQEKIELQAELEHQEYQFRRRAWGTVRFIGEMYKLNALSANRVFLYVELLLKHGNEEKLEYMCKLLTTVGNLLENSDNNARMGKIFSKIQAIVKEAKNHSNKKTKICSRVRFMMQDLIDLRSKNWGQSPCTQSSHVALRRRYPDDKNSNLPSGSMNTYDRGVSHRVMFGNNNRHNQARSKESGAGGSSSGNYFMSKSKSQYLVQQNREQTIDVNKLNFSRGDDSTKLGNSTIHMWRTMPSRQTNQSNGLQQNDRNSVTATQLNTSNQKQQQQAQSLDIKNIDSSPDIQSILDSCTRKDSDELVNHLLEEYLDCITSRSPRWREEVFSIWQKTNTDQQICVVYHILMEYLHSYKVKDIERNACANIFIYLMSCSAFNKSIFTRAYDQFAVDFPEILLLDVPNGWTYVFQFLGPLLHKRLLTFKDIWHKSWRSDELFTERFVNALVAYFTREFGANYMRDLWSNEFKLGRGHLFKSDQQEWHKFVTSNKLQFLYDSKAKPEIVLSTTNSDSSTVMHQHMQRVEVLLSSLNDPNLALDYINTNVNINSSFLEGLTRFLCCNYATTTTASTNKNSSTCSNNSSSNVKNVKNSSLSNNSNNNAKYAQLNADAFRNNCLPLLRLCLDAHEEYELICLDSVVDAVQHDYDADTAEELICGIFDILYDCEVIAKESFEKWYKQRQQQSRKATLSPKNHLEQPLSSSLEAYMQKLLLTN